MELVVYLQDENDLAILEPLLNRLKLRFEKRKRVETDEEELSDEMKLFLDSRIKAFEENPNDLIEWSDVEKKLHKSSI